MPKAEVRAQKEQTVSELADKLPDSVGDKIEGLIPGDPDHDGK